TLVIAASALMLIGIATTAVYVFWLQGQTLSAPPADLIVHVLPDGSTAEISGGSKLTYRRGFRGGVRAVGLRGDAFFDVREEERPFVVQTANASVSAVGTSFGV